MSRPFRAVGAILTIFSMVLTGLFGWMRVGDYFLYYGERFERCPSPTFLSYQTRDAATFTAVTILLLALEIFLFTVILRNGKHTRLCYLSMALVSVAAAVCHLAIRNYDLAIVETVITTFLYLIGVGISVWLLKSAEQRGVRTAVILGVLFAGAAILLKMPMFAVLAAGGFLGCRSNI
ncbi:MAG: hypothetical protein MJ175_04360 [Clostridia bacterium]|nr:hypothetical protein [Clostridia bacterium]